MFLLLYLNYVPFKWFQIFNCFCFLLKVNCRIQCNKSFFYTYLIFCRYRYSIIKIFVVFFAIMLYKLPSVIISKVFIVQEMSVKRCKTKPKVVFSLLFSRLIFKKRGYKIKPQICEVQNKSIYSSYRSRIKQ